jgi:Mg2+ and Co2+ transporter CorA
MNFDYMPELHFHYSYYIFWVIVVITTAIAATWVRGSFTLGMVADRQRRDL